MAHFAKLKDGNIVERIEVVSNDVATTEEAGVNFLRELYNEPNAAWVQTSYNSSIRKNFAIIGGFYDADRDAFYEQQPYDSWTLNEDTCQWQAPIPYPTAAEGYTETDGGDDRLWIWNETTKVWDEIKKI